MSATRLDVVELDGTMRRASELVPKNDTFSGGMRWAEALLALSFGVGGALLAVALLFALKLALDHNQLAAACAVTVVWMSGLGVVVGAWAARLRSLSVTDPLTGLFNRRFLARRLKWVLQRGRRDSIGSALLYIDLDRLKQLNDRFGHFSGDLAIIAVAETIFACIRTGDVAARVGGDEFNVLLARTSVAEAELVGQRIGAALAARCGPWIEPLTVSIGVAGVGEDVVREADAALYRAKQAGGGRVVAVSS